MLLSGTLSIQCKIRRDRPTDSGIALLATPGVGVTHVFWVQLHFDISKYH